VRVAEMKFIEHMIAGRENSPASLMMLLETERRVAERMQNIRDISTDYRSSAAYRTSPDPEVALDKLITGYKAKNPIFSPEELKDPKLLAGGLAETRTAEPKPPRHFNTTADLDAAIKAGQLKGVKEVTVPGVNPGDPPRILTLRQ
jgi:hypothetical protein